MLIGIILVLLGFVLILQYFGLITGDIWKLFWALVIIAIGLSIVFRRCRWYRWWSWESWEKEESRKKNDESKIIDVNKSNNS